MPEPNYFLLRDNGGRHTTVGRVVHTLTEAQALRAAYQLRDANERMTFKYLIVLEQNDG